MHNIITGVTAITHPVKGEPVPLSQVREDFAPVPQDDHTQPGRPCGCGLHKRIRLLEGYGSQMLDLLQQTPPASQPADETPAHPAKLAKVK